MKTILHKLTICIVITLGFMLPVQAQCPPGGIDIYSQAQVDAFATNYPNCTEIQGNLTISGSNITNLNGLSALTNIGGFFQINGNNALINIEGLNVLTSIGGNFIIGGNNALINIEGLNNLTSIGGNFLITGNNALTNIEGLNALINLAGNLKINHNTLLNNLNGLSALTSIGGNLTIYYNNALVNIDGLSSLTSVGEYVTFQDNSALTDLDGLSALTSIWGHLQINGNNALTDISGVENITGVTELYILNNSVLSACNIASVCTFLEGTGNRIISGNAGNCINEQAVINVCAIYEISVTTNPTTGGAVTGNGTFYYGISVTVEATANTGYTFVNWTENGTEVSTDATYTFVVEEDRDLVANFTCLPIHTVLAVTECSSYTWLENNQTYTESGSYTHVVSNANNCDSTITLNLTINQPTSSSLAVTECSLYTWLENNQTYTESGSYTHVVSNTNNCDSTITLNLTINTVDNTVSANGITLTANQTGASYQWIDCDDNNAPISGETAQTFTATTNGNYAVVITSSEGCETTSTCMIINTVGIETLEASNWNVYPNPNNGVFTVSTTQLQENTLLEIYTQDGKLIHSTNYSGTETTIDLKNEARGVYILRVNNESYFRVIKN